MNQKLIPPVDRLKAIPGAELRRIKAHVGCFLDVAEHREAGCTKFKTDADGELCCVECGASFLTNEDLAEMEVDDAW